VGTHKLVENARGHRSPLMANSADLKPLNWFYFHLFGSCVNGAFLVLKRMTGTTPATYSWKKLYPLRSGDEFRMDDLRRD